MASSSPPPSGRHADADADADEGPGVPAQAGESGWEGRGGRLRPAPPPVAHAPLLLGLDTEGAEHPQGPEHADDESLTGRVWGCVCGWRGTIRDVSTRPFHPRVGDGGRLRRQRLARSDRDARTELDSHLARATRPAPSDSAAPTTPKAGSVPLSRVLGPGPIPGRDRPRGPRRRLTLPRGPVASNPTAVPAAATTPQGEREPRASAADVAPKQPAGSCSAGPPPDEETYLSPRVEPRDDASIASETDEAGSGARDETLAAAADRARAAHHELQAAGAALDALVARVHKEGASWRAIARATGVSHREAATRWGDPDSEPAP